jgi:hypothetical protein
MATATTIEDAMRAALSSRINMTRILLAVAGAAAMAWAVAVLPVLWSGAAVGEVARGVIAGETFKPEVLGRAEASSGPASAAARRSSILSRAAVIRLRQTEDAITTIATGDIALVDRRLESLDQSVRAALRNAPDDPFLWLTLSWIESRRNGLRSDNLRYLQMSYELGPHEGWIALKRNRFALAARPLLPSDLAERPISEFAELVRWGLNSEASAIAAQSGPKLRAILFAGLKDLSEEERGAFARVFYTRELDEVPVPGFPPPVPKIPMPVLPPDL